MCRVLEGGRPNRPPSGFSDQLWELLVSTWCVEDGSQRSKRPPTSVILGQLREDVHKWGKSITPPALVFPRNRRRRPSHVGERVSDLRPYAVESTGPLSGRLEDDGRLLLVTESPTRF